MRLTRADGWPARLGAVAALALLASACGAGRPAANGRYPLATGPTAPSPLTILHGPLGARVNGDGSSCVWVDAGGHQTAVVWPAGFTAKGNPVTVYDAAGNKFGVAGKPVDLIGGQVMSTAHHAVRGCDGLSQWISGPVPARPEASTTQPQEFDQNQVGQMAGVIYANRTSFGGLWADPQTNIVTIYVPDDVDTNTVARLLPQLSATTPSAPPGPGLPHYRVGFVRGGPSLARLDGVISQITGASGWRDFMQNNVLGYGVDQKNQTANFQVDVVDPVLSAAAVAQFHTLVSLETRYYAPPTKPSLPSGMVAYRIAAATRPGFASMLALASGTLEGQTNPDGTACFWLSGGTSRTAIVWPYGFSAAGPPLSIYSDKGKLVGRVGQRVSLGGGGAPDGTSNPLGCHGTFTGVFLASP